VQQTATLINTRINIRRPQFALIRIILYRLCTTAYILSMD